MQQVIPSNLNYNDIKPVGFPSHVRQEKFTPIAFNTSTNGVSASDIIRFNISTNGFWDPYSAYLKIEVDVSGMDGIKDTVGSTSCGSQQVDNSASSFISQLIISKGGTEIERIEEYDTIAAILNDMNTTIDSRNARYFEGMYGQNVTAGMQYSNPAVSVTNSAGTSNYLLGFNPLATNFCNNSNATSGGLNNVLAQTFPTIGQVGTNRYEYTLLEQDGKASVEYSPTYAAKLANSSTAIQSIARSLAYNLVVFSGYQKPFCQSLSQYGNEQLLSRNILSTTQYKGQLNQNIYADRQTFCIPIISGLIGVLMPKESYKYIPMKPLQELILEFRLSPYAMFTSGYADGLTNLNNTGNALLALGTTTNPMLSRIWRITKFEINVEMQYFEPNIENIILSQLNTEKGIIIHSQSWMLGPKYQISGGSVPNGTYQVNLGFESLKNVVWVYLPDDFTTYSFCRKQYRLSANITSMYIKVGNEYYPPLPITGYASNPGGYQQITNDVDYNNTEFVCQLYKTFNKFNDSNNECLVNNVNFAVNDRVYDPTNKLALWNGTIYSNLCTAASQPLFHENRCVGRAIYAMNLETLNQDYSVISGINTINNRPFEITLKADNTNAYARPYTKYVFCNYDMLIQLRTTGIQILGRG